MLEFYASKLPGASLHLQRRTLTLPGGGFVQFKTAEEETGLRGESIDYLVVDEAAHIRDLQSLWELALRPCLIDRRGCAWFISTPRGHNYFCDLYHRGRSDGKTWASFQFPSTANPHLDEAELAEIGRDMPALVKRQEIDAEFVQLAGAMFRRGDVRVLESEPAGAQWVRAWDLAFTTKTTSDYTVGARVGMTPDGTVVVANIVRGRWEWPEAVRKIAATAVADGPAVRQGVEVVGAQVGALQTLMADPLLVGLSFAPIPVHADKTTRALPVVSRCEQAKLAIVRAGWNGEFLDELSAFPETRHDDQVDAVAGAFAMLGSGYCGFTSEDLRRLEAARGKGGGPLDLTAADYLTPHDLDLL
jgi:predicted phage terminase large subunit-like protein